MLARASWPMRAPRAAIVLWQSIALAAVLSAFSAGIAIASRLFVPGPDGRPTATITSEINALGWPLWVAYVLVFALTLVIGARLATAVLQVAIATRRRRAHHRMMVDLLDMSHESVPPQVCTQASGLRILDVRQPLAYCLPGVRSRVVVSEGTLNTLSDSEIAAILTHERAHLRARHDLVLEMFTAVHAAFPRFVRSANALNAVRLLIELLADDAALTDFIRLHPGVDPQEGRTLIRNARKEREQAKPPRYFRELFQWIKTAAGVEDEEDESLNEAEDDGVEFPERDDDDGYKA